MIKPNEVIEITATGYLPQLVLCDYKCDNSVFFITPARLEEIYIIKYIGKHRQSDLNPFKARILQ